jgi:hypothetical protein
MAAAMRSDRAGSRRLGRARPLLPIVLVRRSPHAETRGAVNTTRTFLIALEADPRLLMEFASMQ